MKSYDEMARSVLSRRDRYAAEQEKRRKTAARTVLSAACCCAVALLCVGLWPDRTPAGITDLSGDSIRDSAVTTGSVVTQYAVTEEAPGSTGPKEPDRPVPEDVPMAPPDMPKVSENGVFQGVSDTGKLSARGTELYGGLYVNGSRLTVVITSDTPENRRLLCGELGFDEVYIDFVPGKYSLAYLTQLQEKITAGMVEKRFPFVVGSGVYEMENRVGITVTTEDQALLDQVLVLDTLGGAITVEKGAVPVADALTVIK